MRDPNILANYPSTMWLRATAEDYSRADPTPALVWVARDAMAGSATLTPVTSEHPLLARICETCED